MLREIGLYVMAVLFILAGAMHFIQPRFYLRIVPPFLKKWDNLVVFWSGVVEIVLGVLLFFPGYRPLAAWGVIALLVAVFPANFYHWKSGGAGMKVPGWALLVRLPLQGVLIAWAYLYT